ncbi:MAG: SNF2 helicase-associated domain-containing protein [Gemmataceae bacterium]
MCRAVWQPVVTGPDGQAAGRSWARAMPAACRALSRSADRPPEAAPVTLLTGFLDRVCDYLVRLAMLGPESRAGKGGRVQVVNLTSVHDKWLYGLNSTHDGAMAVTAAEAAELVEQVRAWQRPIAVSSATAFGLCFRVEEPGEGKPPSAPWRVRYLLQARDDPSLFVPVAEAWKPKGKATHVFATRGFNPREYLLTALGQAAALCPPVEKSLKSAAPSEFYTDATGAYRFLSETAWLLEQAGFTVLLPAWWTRKGSRQRLSVQAEVTGPAMKGPAGLSMDKVVQFDWQVAIGEEPLTLAELQELARLKAPLVKVRGQWVQVHAEEIQTAIALLERRAGSQATLREVVQMALGGGKGPGGLPFAGVKATGWVAEFLSQLEGKGAFAELSPPDGFHGTLRPYQVRGYSWLAFLRGWGLGACLADDMGLGKTIQTLALLLREYDLARKPSLLVCPTSVVANWKKEAERFTPELPVLIHHGGGRVRARFAKQVASQAIVVTSYRFAPRPRAVRAGAVGRRHS